MSSLTWKPIILHSHSTSPTVWSSPSSRSHSVWRDCKVSSPPPHVTPTTDINLKVNEAATSKIGTFSTAVVHAKPKIVSARLRDDFKGSESALDTQFVSLAIAPAVVDTIKPPQVLISDVQKALLRLNLLVLGLITIYDKDVEKAASKKGKIVSEYFEDLSKLYGLPFLESLCKLINSKMQKIPDLDFSKYPVAFFKIKKAESDSYGLPGVIMYYDNDSKEIKVFCKLLACTEEDGKQYKKALQFIFKPPYTSPEIDIFQELVAPKD